MLDSTNLPYGRRKFLKTAGIAGTGLLAGCSGTGDGNSDGGDGGSDNNDDGGDSSSDGDETSFPTRDIKLVIPFGPGGGYDYYGRLLAQYLPDHLPGDVNVQAQNVEGAGGQIATDQMWNAEPDGYSSMIFNVPNFSLTQLTEDVEWDLREFTHFGQVVEEPRGIAVGANSGIETWDDYVEAAQNEELKFASTGPGSGYVTVPGVTGEVSGLYDAQSVMDNQVTYDGRGEAIQGILAGDAQVMAGAYFSLLPYVESGDLRMILALSTEDEPPEHTPEADTLSTADIDNAQEIIDMLTDRRTFGGPPGMPEDITEIWRDAFESTLNDDELLAAAEEEDRPIEYADAESTQESIAGFIESWSQREELLLTLYDM